MKQRKVTLWRECSIGNGERFPKPFVVIICTMRELCSSSSCNSWMRIIEWSLYPSLLDEQIRTENMAGSILSGHFLGLLPRWIHFSHSKEFQCQVQLQWIDLWTTCEKSTCSPENGHERGERRKTQFLSKPLWRFFQMMSLPTSLCKRISLSRNSWPFARSTIFGGTLENPHLLSGGSVNLHRRWMN